MSLLSRTAVVLAGTLALLSARPADAAPAISDEDVAKVQQMRREGRFQDALQLLKAHEGFAARDTRVFALIGLIQFDENRVAESEATITSVHPFGSYQGDDPLVWLLLGQLQTNRYAQPALYGSKTGEERLLNIAKAYLDLAALRAKGDPELAFAIARNRALREKSFAAFEEVAAFESRQDELPKGMFQRFLPECTVEVVRAATAAGSYDARTLACLERAAQLLPDDFLCQWTLARAQVETDRTDEAQAAIAKIKEKFPEHVGDAEYLNARIFERKNDHAQALEHANNAVFLSGSRYVPALEIAARCEFALGGYDRMKVHLERIRTLAPGSRDLYVLFTRYYLKMAEEKTEEGDRQNLVELAERECMDGRRLMPYDLELLELTEQIFALSKKERTDVDRKELATKLKMARSMAAQKGK